MRRTPSGPARLRRVGALDCQACLVATPAVGARSADRTGAAGGAGGLPESSARPLIIAGVLASCVVTASGLAAVSLLVLVGWIAAPHSSFGLPAALRTAAVLWLAGQHVAFTWRGAGRIGMLPLGLVVLPGALLWRAGRWVVRTAQVSRLARVGHAALALAVPYCMLTAALAVASRSALVSASLPEALVCGLLLALVAGGLGGARALAPWSQLVRLLADRERSVLLGLTGALAILITSGAALAAAALATHLQEYAHLQDSLAPGLVGTALLLLLQLGYLPNAIAWAIAFSLGPGFAFGSGTTVAATGSALGALPALPVLAALPPGVHGTMPTWLAPVVLALPYLAGGVGGVLIARTAPALTAEAAPLWGLACGAVAGGLLGLVAAFSGGPLGDSRLAAVGPSGWQVAVVAALEIGVSAAVTAGLVNYVALRRASRSGAPGSVAGRGADKSDPASTRHVIYLDPRAGDKPGGRPPGGTGPSALP